MEQGKRTVSERLPRWDLKEYMVPLPPSFRSSTFGKSWPHWTTEFLEASLTRLLSQDLPPNGRDLESLSLDFLFRDLEINLNLSGQSPDTLSVVAVPGLPLTIDAGLEPREVVPR